VATVVRIVSLMAQRKHAPSILSALRSSYPHMLVRIIAGLDILGLDTYWKIRREVPQQQRRDERATLQTGLGSIAFEILHDTTEPLRNVKHRISVPKLEAWIRTLIAHPDLFAVMLAYACFGTPHGDPEADALWHVLQCYDPSRESLYALALERYVEFNRAGDQYAWQFLYDAERTMGDHTIDRLQRHFMVSQLLGAWATLFADEFITAVPLLRWVDDDTVRENLDL